MRLVAPLVDMSPAPVATQPERAGSSGGVSPLSFKEGQGQPLQLLTAHESGQLQLWDLSLGELRPLAIIGERANTIRYGHSPFCAFDFPLACFKCCLPYTRHRRFQ